MGNKIDTSLPPLMLISPKSRVLWAVVILVGLTLGFRLLFEAHWQTKLDAQHAALRAVGKATRLEELPWSTQAPGQANDPPAILGRAYTSLSPRMDSPRNSNESYGKMPPFPQRWVARAMGSEWVNAPAMDIIRQSRLSGRPIEPINPIWLRKKGQSLLSGFSSYTSARAMATTLSDSAIYLQMCHHDKQAIDRLLDVEHVSDLLIHEPSEVSLLVRMGICSLTNLSAMTISPHLDWHDPQVAAAGLTLARSLTDDQPLHQAVMNAITVERCVSIKDFLPIRLGWALDPLFIGVQDKALTSMAILEKAVDDPATPTWPAGISPPYPLDQATASSGLSSLLGRQQTIFAVMDAPTQNGRYLKQYHAVLTFRHATAISLATNAYRAKTGHWPASLEDLCPDYLPAVPADLTRADRGKMQYHLIKMGNRQRPILWLGESPFDPQAVSPERVIEPTALPSIPNYRDLSDWVPLTTMMP